MEVTFQLKNDLAELKTLRDRLQALQHVWLLPPKTAAEINLILEEVVANIIEHGDQDRSQEVIDISLSKEGPVLTMTIVDRGPSFDPTLVAPPDTRLPLQHRKCGGLGLHLVRTLCQGCSYTREKEANILTLKKNLANQNR
jgi:serine/threonine-protein kinase RsbW